MAPPLAETTAQAQTLTSAGDLIGARDILARALDPRDADPQRATPDLATAAALHARILIALGDPHGARTWAGFAHAAEQRLHGPHDERAVAAAATHAAVLTRTGNHGRAAQLYHDLIGALTALDGPESVRALAAEADLATTEHAAGQCTAARARLTEAWTRHRQVYGDAAPAGIKMLARLGAMERECGRLAESRDHLTLAQELAARYLSADHPLAGQVVGLSRARASGRHVCGRVLPSSGPGVDAMPPPDNRTTDPKGTIYQQPLYLSQVHQAPGELTGRHARADTPLPLPGPRIPEYTPQGRRVPVGTASIETGDPAPDDRRLPVPVRSAPATSRQPFVLAAMLVAGIGVAVAVVAATLLRDPAAPTPVGSAPPVASTAAVSTSATPSAAPTGEGASEGTPTGVRLRDNRTSVQLTWTYPKSSDGPVLISGGRSGQERRAFQQLPAGTGDYLVYGLNEQLDYCFTVAVVHSTERVATSAPVCTARR